jgi:hypothetical protein
MIRFSEKLRYGSLACLLVVTLIAAAMPDSGGDRGGVVEAVERPRGQPERPQGQPLADQANFGREPMEVALNRLRERTLEDAGENPFINKSWYAPPPPPPPAAIAAVPLPPPAPAPAAPALPFSYMGKVLAEGEQSSLFFLIRGDRLYAVTEGDLIDNTYRVDGLRSGQLGLTYLPLNIKQFITVGDDT